MTSNNKDVIGNFEVENGQLKTRREVLLMGALAAAGGIATTAAQAQNQVAAVSPAALTKPSPVVAKDYSYLVAKNMEGLSAKQIEPHLKLYQGYVTKTNELQSLLTTIDPNNPAANATYHPLREVLMEISYAQNGVVYHEYYFNNLGGAGGEPGGDLRAALEARWGTMGKFMDFFKAAGKCMRGWVVVGWNTRDGSMQAYGLDLHNMWVPENVIPVVVLDVYEHAYMIDYGTNRAAYLDAFLKNVDWNVCAKRLDIARRHPAGLDATV